MLFKEVHCSSQEQNTAADVEDGEHMETLPAQELHDAVVDVVRDQVEEEDHQELVGGHGSSCPGHREVEAEGDVDQTVQ